MKNLIVLITIVIGFKNTLAQQRVGIGTNTPQATLDVKGNELVGGATHFTSFDSAGGKIEWRNANLYAPVSQYLMRHSAAADGLYYNNTAPVSGQLEYRNAAGNPVFFTNFNNGNGYFINKLGIGNASPQFPLSLNGALGDKISLWTDGTPTHYGMGIQSGLFQIFSKTSLDDIALGYGSSTAFTESMRIKGNGNVGIGNNPAFKLDLTGRMRIRTGADGEAGIWLNNAANSTLQSFIGLENDNYVGFYGAAGWKFAMNTQTGALKINGSEGVAGHVLQSNGAAAPTWVATQKLFISSSHTFNTLVNNGDETVVSSVAVTVTQDSHVEITGTVGLFSAGCFNCGDAQVFILINDPLEPNEKLVAANSHVISVTTMNFQYRTISPLPPGNYVFTVKAKKMSGPTVQSATGNTGPYGSPIARLTAKVIPF